MQNKFHQAFSYLLSHVGLLHGYIHELDGETLFGSKCLHSQPWLFDCEYIWFRTSAAAPSKWLLHWFVVSCLMPITGILSPQREISMPVSNTLTKMLSVWILGMNWINRLKKASQPMDEASERVKSTITPFRHNKEQIAGVIVISSRVM